MSPAGLPCPCSSAPGPLHRPFPYLLTKGLCREGPGTVWIRVTGSLDESAQQHGVLGLEESVDQRKGCWGHRRRMQAVEGLGGLELGAGTRRPHKAPGGEG